MSEPLPTQPILDYAGPASRSSLRLAAKSEIHIDDAADRVLVREILAGRGEAIGALVFALFIIVVICSLEMGWLPKWRRYVVEMFVCGMFPVAEIVVGALVVNQTWRRTVFVATADDVSLDFTAPMSKAQRLTWPTRLLEEVEVVDSVLKSGLTVPELELRLSAGGPVRLFTGHPKPQLDWLASRIRDVTKVSRRR